MLQNIIWLSDGQITTGDTVGGDELAGECYTARYLSAQVPCGVIDVHCYTIGPTEDTPAQRWTYRWAATYTLRPTPQAPIGSEGEWCDVVYREPPEDGEYAGENEANAAALTALSRLDPGYLTWEGRCDVRELFPY